MPSAEPVDLEAWWRSAVVRLRMASAVFGEDAEAYIMRDAAHDAFYREAWDRYIAGLRSSRHDL